MQSSDYNNHNAIVGYRSQPLAMPMPMQQQQQMPQQPDTPEAGLLQVLWRRKLIVVFVMLLVIAGAAVYVRQAVPIYTATASLVVESPANIVGPGAAAAQLNLLQQARIIQSSEVLDVAIASNDLDKLRSLKGNALVLLRKGLVVDVGAKDDVIAVSFDSPDPKEAAKIVNGVADAYASELRAESANTFNQVTGELKIQQTARADEVKQKDLELQQFLKDHPDAVGASVGGASPDAGRLQQYSQALTDAQLRKIQAQANWASNESAVTRRIYDNARTTEAEIQAEFDAAQKKYYQGNTVNYQFNQLKSDLDQAKAVKARLDQLIEQAMTIKIDNTAPTARVIEQAGFDNLPMHPSKSRVLGIGAVAGLILGIGFGLLRDWMDQRLKSAEEVMATLGVPVLGTVPHMSRRLTAVQRGQKVFLEPMSDAAEAFRTIRTAVYFNIRSEKAKTSLLTSSEPGDGKSTTCANLAIAMAQAGQRTLLLDCDFRKPTQHKIFEVSDAGGVSTVLAGRETLEKAIQRTAIEGLDVLPGGPIPLNPSEILNSQAFADMLDELSVKYDNIVIDSPPVNAVTDARILGALCDVTILVLRADKTTRKHAEYARDGLMSVGARLLGCVVNDVSRGKNRAGFYSGYGYYGNAANAVAVTAGGPVSTRVTPRRLLRAEGMD